MAAATRRRVEILLLLRAVQRKVIRKRNQIMFPCIALAKDQTWQPSPYTGIERRILHHNSGASDALFHATKSVKHGPPAAA
jgi:hypothetical protein